MPRKAANRKADNSKATPRKNRTRSDTIPTRTLKASNPDSLDPWRYVSADLLAHFGVVEADLEGIRQFARLEGTDKVREGRRILQEAIIDAQVVPDSRCALAVAESESLLAGYATLDEPHRAEVARLVEQIGSYLRDPTRKRPFNALMLASPGAGKSHFIKQVAARMRADRVQAVTFNMATMNSPDDLAQPVDELRNLKVNDRFPLLFLDEFDSDPSRYAFLLPLLWDGELHVGHRDLKLGKVVIVLAGSSPELPKTMVQSAQMRNDADRSGDHVAAGKLVDLLSRINGGVIDIPDLELRTEQRDRRVDKICVAIALLKSRFGDDLSAVPRAFLRFIALTSFRYGVRSIAHVVDEIRRDAFRGGVLSRTSLGLPIDSEAALQGSSLRFHLLDKNQGFGIVDRWTELKKDEAVVNVNSRGILSLLPFRA